MLRNRGTSSSRGAMNTKQAVIGDHHQSSTENCYKKPPTVLQSFFVSPRFRALFTNSLAAETHHELSPTSLISPTSILDSTKQHFSPFCNPIWDHDILLNPKTPTPTPTPKSPNLFSENKQHHHQEVVGLALIDKESSSSNKQTINSNYNHQVLFGTKLRVIKTLPTNEMELSEEYTCVISRGPNPKTTRIFDNCVLEESYCSLPDSDSDAKYYSSSAPDNFLSLCYTCKKNLEQNYDIYIYRGEKAFCSQECRYQEMLLDDGVEN